MYGKWLEELPKKIEGGPIELTPCDGHGEEDDAYNLESHSIRSTVLDSPYVKHIYIMGVYEKYEGFKIYVNIKDKFRDKFLLMGHQHHSGSFETEDHRTFGDHPHFHQIKYIKRRSTIDTERTVREPRKTYEIPESLHPEMDSAQLLKAFLKEYYLDDGGDGEIKKVTRSQVQCELGRFEETVEGAR